MKFTVAFAILGATYAQQQQQQQPPNQYKRITKLRGADLNSSPTTTNNNSLRLTDNSDSELLATCQALSQDNSCDANDSCTWCEAGAVPSSCYPVTMAGQLPAGVFQCSKSSVVSVGASSPSAVDAIEETVEEEVAVKSQTFNLKEGISLTLTTDSVDKEFCDPNSEVSLAGYMNVKGSQFDTNNDKNLFFWMFEKRTTSLVPSSSDNGGGSVEGKVSWEWPWSSPKPDASPADDAPQQQPAEQKTETTVEGETPLVIWLTGGPGCSSSLALLTENGPCSVNQDGATTTVNPHSWTESAHVLWLDQPANVGYSYGQDNDTNEEMISEDAYYFLQAFFQSEEGEKYKDAPLFIVGESYGGREWMFDMLM
jgi:hypothetical protein